MLLFALILHFLLSLRSATSARAQQTTSTSSSLLPSISSRPPITSSASIISSSATIPPILDDADATITTTTAHRAAVQTWPVHSLFLPIDDPGNLGASIISVVRHLHRTQDTFCNATANLSHPAPKPHSLRPNLPPTIPQPGKRLGLSHRSHPHPDRRREHSNLHLFLRRRVLTSPSPSYPSPKKIPLTNESPIQRNLPSNSLRSPRAMRPLRPLAHLAIPGQPRFHACSRSPTRQQSGLHGAQRDFGPWG